MTSCLLDYLGIWRWPCRRRAVLWAASGRHGGSSPLRWSRPVSRHASRHTVPPADTSRHSRRTKPRRSLTPAPLRRRAGRSAAGPGTAAPFRHCRRPGQPPSDTPRPAGPRRPRRNGRPRQLRRTCPRRGRRRRGSGDSGCFSTASPFPVPPPLPSQKRTAGGGAPGSVSEAVRQVARYTW